MKTITRICILFLTINFSIACVAVPPGGGGAYLGNKFKAPYKTFPVKQGELESTSTARCYISLVCLGDATVRTAAKNGGIKYITNIDYEYFNIFMFYSRTTVIVNGHAAEK